MRTATIYNFLLEANLMASVAILLMIVIRKVLRKPLGNRLVYFLWLLIAIRLLCPLAFGNPYINEFRPTFLQDEAIRPIAGQIKVRFTDAADAISDQTASNRDSILYQSATSIEDGMYYGTLGRKLMWVYLFGAGVVLLWFGYANVRYRRKLKANRIEQISGKLQEQYLAVCRERKAKPLPVWFVDPLPSACLVGVIHPYIALPLTAAPQEAVHVLTHEVCHYKGKDHWGNVLRLLCCVIHWFNPLVWLGAYLSRTDGELACDSRVVRTLSPNDRADYTNTLVLAASRRYAPGVGVLATGMTMTGKKLQNRVRSILNSGQTVKWLMAVVAVLACVALVLTFFTAEKYVFPTIPTVSAAAGLTTEQPLQSEDDALQLAKTFLCDGTLALDVADAAWNIGETDTTYEINVVSDVEDTPITMTLLKNGVVSQFIIPSNADYCIAVSNMYSHDAEQQQEIADYIAAFWEANMPGIAGTIDTLTFSSEGTVGDERFLTYYGGNAISDMAYWFTVQVMPQVQIVDYHANYEMIEYWMEEMQAANDTAETGTGD